MATRGKGIPHLFDDEELTFDELLEFGILAVLSKLDRKVKLVEKIDGQNLLITYNNGLVLGVGNSTQMKSIQDIEDRYETNPEVRDLFTRVYNFVDSCFEGISNDYLVDVFEDGQVFLNVEIYHPEFRNVIHYSYEPSIFLHNFIRVEGNRRLIQKDKSLLDVYSSLNLSNYTGEFFWRMPNPVMLNEPFDKDIMRQVKTHFEMKMAMLMSSVSLTTKNTLQEYYIGKFRNIVNSKFPSLSSSSKEVLINRWGRNDRSYRISLSTVIDRHLLREVKDYDRIAFNTRMALKDHFKYLFLLVGNYACLNTTNIACEDISKANELLENDLRDFYDSINAMEEFGEKAVREDELIIRLGGFSKFVPIEGFVFDYKGTQYKLTGMYTPINRLLAFVKYSK
jgi:hypothetical protein